MTDAIIQRLSGEQTRAVLDDIADVYIDAHSGNADEDDEMFSRPSFISRTESQAQMAGFELITATSENTVIGFSFGYQFSPGQWWSDCTPPTQEILDSTKFAVIELSVRRGCQGRGIGKKLFTELLAHRDEDFATLAATPGSQAYAMYERWGWNRVGTFETPPIMDALGIRLKQNQATAANL